MHPELFYGFLAAAVMLIKVIAPGPWLAGLKILPVGLLALLSWRAYRQGATNGEAPADSLVRNNGSVPAEEASHRAREAHRWVSLGLTISCLADGIIELSFVAGLVGFLFGHLCYIRMMGPMPFQRKQLFWFGVTGLFVATILSLTWEKLPQEMWGRCWRTRW